MDFIEDLKINPEELDLEWLRQPQLYARYAEETSRLKAVADRAKEQVEVIRAELDREVRTTPEKFGLAKLTEGALEAVIRQHPTYTAAKERQFTTAEEAAQGFNALGALEHRKSALENLVKLHAAHYFAGPSAPHDLGAMMRERSGERRQEQVREVMKRRQPGRRDG